MARRRPARIAKKDRFEAKSPKTPQLDKKLALYVLTGAALAAPSAQAGPIYFVVNQTVNQTGSFAFNLSGPASADVVLRAWRNGSFNEIMSSAGVGAGVLEDNGVDTGILQAVPLNYGDLIGPASTTWGTSGKLASVDSGGNLASEGAWINQTHYLGFYFAGLSGPQYGWAYVRGQASVTTSSFTVYSYGYETEPNTAIAAGTVPEPCSMALIALGAAGLVALRRRRKANA